MQVVGITGTNGKTTTSYLVSEIFEAAGIKCGLMGTVTYRIGDREFPQRERRPRRLTCRG
jgi:UDP-N-acetylmuramoyl-L-alanyl-D-glutamate--2,6-diaminopimelate ligase